MIGTMSPIEIAAVVLGLVNVTLVVRRSIWNYPFALAMVALYAWIFWGVKLYSDMLLQGFFFAVNIYGWWYWARSIATEGDVVVERLTPGARAGWVAGCLVATASWGWLMHRYTDAAFPWWDAGVAMASVAAQILQSRRKIESWVLWIGVDVAAIGLYAAKGLMLTPLLYALFLLLSIWGLVDWRRAERRESTT
jgi:nicotinamide mononucleotide transporter